MNLSHKKFVVKISDTERQVVRRTWPSGSIEEINRRAAARAAAREVFLEIGSTAEALGRLAISVPKEALRARMNSRPK